MFESWAWHPWLLAMERSREDLDFCDRRCSIRSDPGSWGFEDPLHHEGPCSSAIRFWKRRARRGACRKRGDPSLSVLAWNDWMVPCSLQRGLRRCGGSVKIRSRMEPPRSDPLRGGAPSPSDPDDVRSDCTAVGSSPRDPDWPENGFPMECSLDSLEPCSSQNPSSQRRRMLRFPSSGRCGVLGDPVCVRWWEASAEILESISKRSVESRPGREAFREARWESVTTGLADKMRHRPIPARLDRRSESKRTDSVFPGGMPMATGSDRICCWEILDEGSDVV